MLSLIVLVAALPCTLTASTTLAILWRWAKKMPLTETKMRLLLLFAYTALALPALAGWEIRITSIDFDTKGVPEKITCALRGLVTEQWEPGVVMCDKNLTRNIASSKKMVHPDKASYEIQTTIDIAPFVVPEGHYDPTSWDLTVDAQRLRGDAPCEFIQLARIGGMKIGLCVIRYPKDQKAE